MTKHLLFIKDYWDKLMKGEKTLTIRYGIVKDYRVGDKVYIHCGGYVLGLAEIVDIKHKKLKDITEEEAYLDGFSSVKDLLKKLKEHYPNIKGDDDVTLIRFKWIKKFDKPVLSEEFAWKGISLSPKEIAELALKHLDKELTEKQKYYLKLVITEGSIRKAAIKLGGLHKRILFRKIFRRVLEKLIEKGVIKS